MKGSIYNRLHIPKPCHEDWNRMTPDEKGAFCKQCNKSVYDFTARNEQEVEAIMLSLKGQEVCGRFNNDQLAPLPELEIPLYAIPQKLSPFRRFALAAFIVFGTTLFGCVNAYGQKMGKVKLTTKNVETPPPVKEEKITMKGEVAFIPEKDTAKIIKCTARPVDKDILTGDTILLPENIQEIQPVIGPDEIIETVTLGNVSMVNEEMLPVEGPVGIELAIDTVNLTDYDSIRPYTMGFMAFIPQVIDVPAITPAGDPLPVIDPVQVMDPGPGIEPLPIMGQVISVPVINPEPVEEEDKTLIGDALQNDTAAANDKTILPAGDVPKPSLQCWPNPSTGPVTISYEIKKRSNVTLQLFDSYGRTVRTLVSIKDCYNAVYNNTFDLSDLDAGTYTCVLQSGSEVSTTRVVIVK